MSRVAASRFKAARYGFAVSASQAGVISMPPIGLWRRPTAGGGWSWPSTSQSRTGAAWCRATFAIPDGVEPLGYADEQSGDLTARLLRRQTGCLAALFLAPEPVAVARNWAISQLTAEHTNLRNRFALVAGRPGADKPDPGATVCSCFGVGINQIVAAVRSGCHSVEAVGEELNAGTNCGSCRAEIRGIIDGCLAAAAE